MIITFFIENSIPNSLLNIFVVRISYKKTSIKKYLEYEKYLDIVDTSGKVEITLSQIFLLLHYFHNFVLFLIQKETVCVSIVLISARSTSAVPAVFYYTTTVHVACTCTWCLLLFCCSDPVKCLKWLVGIWGSDFFSIPQDEKKSFQLLSNVYFFCLLYYSSEDLNQHF